MNKPIEHVIICNFNTNEGAEVEYIYPPLSKKKRTKKMKVWLEKFSEFCLPTGCHQSESGFLFFNVMSPSESNSSEREVFYCVSCYRMAELTDQMKKNQSKSTSKESEELNQNNELEKEKKKEKTKKHKGKKKKNKKQTQVPVVQKAVAVVSRLPLYGTIREKLSIITQAFFEQENFQDKEIIHNIYSLLNSTFVKVVSEEHVVPLNLSESLHLTSSPRKLMGKIGNDALTLLKMILLEKKIIIYSHSPEEVSDMIATLFSLLPFFTLSHLPSRFRDLILDSFRQRREKQKTEIEEENTTTEEYEKWKIYPSDFGLPLEIINENTFFNPYSPNFQIHRLLNMKKMKGFCVGTSDPIYLSRSQSLGVDIIADLNQKNDIFVYIAKDLKRAMPLTKHEKRFLQSINSTSFSKLYKPGKWLGSDDWVRNQFTIYFERLILDLYRYSNVLKTKNISSFELKNADKFNKWWVYLWSTTNNFQKLRKENIRNKLKNSLFLYKRNQYNIFSENLNKLALL
ncbi:late secretory pathway protein avl9 [Anaeramoeba flamelloides]|uniref:Late secretory pathway protein avl9 n=1 Tax=Anaeramoeba flamelloides TaxID=1746091 RepID=A0ABQ8XJ72_9EUKA|nr:late secretory pathway protein avl9 [Anaeramoeba flamelloides]